MALFEQFKPKLKPCEIHREGLLIVVEERNDGRHFVLSSEAGEFIAAFDGKRTIKEIVTDLHRADRPMKFKTLFNTIQQLFKAGFLENEDCPLTPVLERRGKLRRFYERARSLDIKKILIRQIQPNISSRGTFHFSAAFLVAFGLFTAATLHFQDISNNFLSFKGSYVKGILFYVAAVAVILSIKACIQFLLLELGTGKVYGLSIRVSRLSVHFSVSDASIYLARGKFVPAIFHIASFCTALSIIGVASFFVGAEHWFGDLKTIAFFLTLLELNPYYASDFQKLLYLFQKDDIRSHLVPYLKNRALLSFLSKSETVSDDQILVAFSTFAVTWTTGTLYFLSTLMERNCANLLLAIQKLAPPERDAAAVILAGIALHWLYFLFDLLSTVVKNLYYPMSARVDSWLRHRRMKNESLRDPGAAVEVLSKNPLFADLDEATLREFLKLGKVRSYSSDTKLIIQGMKNDTLFAVIEGRVRVTRIAPSSAMNDIVVLGPSSVFGEISAIRGEDATADIVTLGRTICLELNRDALKNLKVERVMEKIQVGHFIGCSPTFRNLPKEVINLVMAKGILGRAAAGQTVFEEGTIGSALFLVVRGSVDVFQGGQRMKTLGQGEFFGEIAVIARVPRTATVKTTVDSVLLQLDSNAFWEIMAENSQFSLFIESIAEMRERDTEQFREAA